MLARDHGILQRPPAFAAEALPVRYLVTFSSVPQGSFHHCNKCTHHNLHLLMVISTIRALVLKCSPRVQNPATESHHALCIYAVPYREGCVYRSPACAYIDSPPVRYTLYIYDISYREGRVYIIGNAYQLLL